MPTESLEIGGDEQRVWNNDSYFPLASIFKYNSIRNPKYLRILQLLASYAVYSTVIISIYKAVTPL